MTCAEVYALRSSSRVWESVVSWAVALLRLDEAVSTAVCRFAASCPALTTAAEALAFAASTAASAC